MTLIRLLILVTLLVLSSTGTAGPRQAPDPALRALLMEAVAETTVYQDAYYAEVWLLDMSSRLERYIPDPYTRITLLTNVHKEATRARVAPELVLSIIHVESLFNPWAISRAGAQGLMQVMPFWLKELNLKDHNLFDMQTNVRLGCTILRYYLDQEKNLTRALARYNGSIGSFRYPNKVYKVLDSRWKRR